MPECILPVRLLDPFPLKQRALQTACASLTSLIPKVTICMRGGGKPCPRTEKGEANVICLCGECL